MCIRDSTRARVWSKAGARETGGGLSSNAGNDADAPAAKDRIRTRASSIAAVVLLVVCHFFFEGDM
jgi:hypothetical protein